MGSDEVTDGWLLGVQYFDTGVSKERIKEVPGRVRDVAKAKSSRLRYGLVDAQPKKFASNL